jgi:hypothetical protein
VVQEEQVSRHLQVKQEVPEEAEVSIVVNQELFIQVVQVLQDKGIVADQVDMI